MPRMITTGREEEEEKKKETPFGKPEYNPPDS
jgi:hypothetical protein